MIETEPKIEIYRNKQTRQCWHLSARAGGVAVLRRGNKTETLDESELDKLFEAVV